MILGVLERTGETDTGIIRPVCIFWGVALLFCEFFLALLRINVGTLLSFFVILLDWL